MQTRAGYKGSDLQCRNSRAVDPYAHLKPTIVANFSAKLPDLEL